MCIFKWIKNPFKKEELQPLYPNELPSLPFNKVIEELEFDIIIHEHWAAYVTQYPSYATSMGDYDWHLRWIKVYQNAIWYIKRSMEVSHGINTI